MLREKRMGFEPRALKFGLLFLVLFIPFGFAVMALWNWLMPAIFGWKLITFWQAIGLLVLSRILFGGFRGRPGGGRGMHGMNWRRRMFERWDKMTPEERERFRQGMQNRWGHCAPPTAEPK